MNALKDKLDSMVGKDYMYRQINYSIKSHDFNDEEGKIIINTDSSPIVFEFTYAQQELSKFLPVDNTPIVVPNSYQPAVDQSTVTNMKDILLENIKKVKDDKNYIPQAKSINENVKSIIELAKTEIEMAKIITSTNKI